MNWQKIILTVLACLTTVSALAQTPTQWITLDKRPGNPANTMFDANIEVYYSGQIKKNGDLANITVLNNAPFDGDSVIFEIEFDCKKNVFRFAGLVVYEDSKMARGKGKPASPADLKDFSNLPASDLSANNDKVGIAIMSSGIRFAALKAVVCDGKSIAEYQTASAAAVVADAAARAALDAASPTGVDNKLAAAGSAVTDWIVLDRVKREQSPSNLGEYEVLYSQTTTKSGDFTLVKVLSNYAPFDRDGVKSDVSDLRFNCAKNTFDLLTSVWYEGAKTSGNVVRISTFNYMTSQPEQKILEVNHNEITYFGGMPSLLISKLHGIVCAASTPASKPTAGEAKAQASAAQTTVNTVDTKTVSYVQERPSPIWAEHAGNDQKPNYLKETGRTENTISLEGNGTKVQIDLNAMRLVVEKSGSKKALNIDEASSVIHGWLVGEVTHDKGQLFFTGQEGPIKAWIERLSDGSETKLIEDDFDEWSVYLKDPKTDATVQIDLYKKIVSYEDGRSKKLRTVKIKSATAVK
jgi:hypothetical protein